MLPNIKYTNLSPEFWANVKLLNQRLGYTRRKSKALPQGGFVVPSISDIIRVFQKEGLDSSKLIDSEKYEFTEFGQLLTGYMLYRGEILRDHVEPNLMDKTQARDLFYEIKNRLNPECPLPMNKQKNEKKDHAFLTGIVNMVIEENKGGFTCDFNPKELTAMTKDGFPVRILSRRVDGAFPSVINPIAIWEIKEYYYTTTFGSRVADGVYETQLDGWELWEANLNIGRKVEHCLIIDDHNTWWGMGRSYLCRIIDTLHMGLLSEAIFGREVVERLPVLVRQWKNKYPENEIMRIAAEPEE